MAKKLKVLQNGNFAFLTAVTKSNLINYTKVATIHFNPCIPGLLKELCRSGSMFFLAQTMLKL